MERFLALLDICVDSHSLDHALQTLSGLPNVEQLYEVTGEFDIVTLVSADGIEEFRDLLKNKILKIKGVKSTLTSIVAKDSCGLPHSTNYNSSSANSLQSVPDLIPDSDRWFVGSNPRT